jgi:hypothetical protein
MRRVGFLMVTMVVVALASLAGGATTAAAASKGAPKLTVVPSCETPGFPFGFSATAVGFPPNEQVLGSFSATTATGGFGAGPAALVADANGTVGPVGVATSVPILSVTVTVVDDLNRNGVADPGEPVLTATLHDPCAPEPVTKTQCKQGGYAAFGFRNQGQCVAFVEPARSGVD